MPFPSTAQTEISQVQEQHQCSEKAQECGNTGSPCFDKQVLGPKSAMVAALQNYSDILNSTAGLNAAEPRHTLDRSLAMSGRGGGGVAVAWHCVAAVSCCMTLA